MPKFTLWKDYGYGKGWSPMDYKSKEELIKALIEELETTPPKELRTTKEIT